MTHSKQFTRGHGIFENYLSFQRSLQVNRLIDQDLRKGRILDVGCGTVPHFLLTTEFVEKFGIDPCSKNNQINLSINIINQLVVPGVPFPFSDQFFDVVTSLGVIEHFNTQTMIHFLNESFRVLKKGGKLILTTPSPWTKDLLKILAMFNFISPDEIKYLERSYSTDELRQLCAQSGFKNSCVKSGHFQFGCNSWIKITKEHA